MTRPPLISRRLLLTAFWLAGTAAAAAQVKRGGKRGSDQGIGGTGITRGNDHGIGGTGIVGVIQRFGSIYVNGERIAYAPDVPVQIDGAPASAKALRVGQLARVVALRQADGTLMTRNIGIASEVSGPIESVKGDEITVLGQKVLSRGKESWRRAGTHVAVFGLRRSDGVIVASLVEQRHDQSARVTGLVERRIEGLHIGGLRLSGADPALVGQRVQVEGSVLQGPTPTLQVARARIDDFSDLVGANRLSIEAYVRRAGGSNLQLGSGLVAHDLSRFAPTSGEARVIVNGVFDRTRGLQVEQVQSVNRFPGSSLRNPGGPTRGPGGSMTGPGGGPPGAPGGRPDGPGAPGANPSPNPGSGPGGSPAGPGGPIGPGGGMGGGGFGGGGGPGGGMGGGRR